MRRWLFGVAAALIAAGIWRGEYRAVLAKASRICLECIGLGVCTGAWIFCQTPPPIPPSDLLSSVAIGAAMAPSSASHMTDICGVVFSVNNHAPVR